MARQFVRKPRFFLGCAKTGRNAVYRSLWTTCRLKKVVPAAFILCLLLSPLLPVQAAGSPADPLVSRSWVEEYIELQVAPLEIRLAALKQEAYARLSIMPVDIMLTVNSPLAVINGESRMIDAAPRIIGAGYTMVPVRVVAESLGIEVEWLPGSRQIKFYDAKKTMLLTIGSDIALIDGREYLLSAAPMIDNSLSAGRTLVHIRFVAEAFGCSLDWEPKQGGTERVYIKR